MNYVSIKKIILYSSNITAEKLLEYRKINQSFKDCIDNYLYDIWSEIFDIKNLIFCAENNYTNILNCHIPENLLNDLKFQPLSLLITALENKSFDFAKKFLNKEEIIIKPIYQAIVCADFGWDYLLEVVKKHNLKPEETCSLPEIANVIVYKNERKLIDEIANKIMADKDGDNFSPKLKDLSETVFEMAEFGAKFSKMLGYKYDTNIFLRLISSRNLDLIKKYSESVEKIRSVCVYSPNFQSPLDVAILTKNLDVIEFIYFFQCKNGNFNIFINPENHEKSYNNMNSPNDFFMRLNEVFLKTEFEDKVDVGNANKGQILEKVLEDFLKYQIDDNE